MNINSVELNVAMREVSAKATAPGTAAGYVRPAQPSRFAQTSQSAPSSGSEKTSNQAQTTSGNGDISPAQVKQMVSEMQSHLDSMNLSVQYFLYGEHERKIAVKVVNKETGEVIREIPPKELQALQTKIGELVGRIFNEKA